MYGTVYSTEHKWIKKITEPNRFELFAIFNNIAYSLEPGETPSNFMTLPKAGDFYIGVYGEILYSLSDLNEIFFRVSLKPSNDRGEFEIDWARC